MLATVSQQPQPRDPSDTENSLATTMSSTSESLSSEIDRLLEHYLTLLDQYTTLRTQLSSQQISTQQDLARAKFHAPPGVQYGESMYDGRMQAQRFVHITTTTNNDSIRYEVTMGEPLSSIPTDPFSTDKDNEDTPSAKNEETSSAMNEKALSKDEQEHNQKSEQNQKPKDPLRMFGYSTPSSLKTAQKSAIQMVENSIPQLCALDAQMAEVEIQIRRARKLRGKAEERESKERNIVEEGRGVVVEV